MRPSTYRELSTCETCAHRNGGICTYGVRPAPLPEPRTTAELLAACKQWLAQVEVSGNGTCDEYAPKRYGGK